MKALTVRQPWAQTIADGLKTVEVRSRPLKYRGELAIHAAAAPDPNLCEEAEGLPLGQVLCVVNVVGCEPLTEAHLAAAYMLGEGWETEGLWAWVLENVRLVKPVAAKGKLSLWNLPDEQITYL